MLRLALARPKAVLAGWAVVGIAIRLVGRAEWRLQHTLDRLLPRIHVEEPATPQDPVADAVARFVGTRRDRVGR